MQCSFHLKLAKFAADGILGSCGSYLAKSQFLKRNLESDWLWLSHNLASGHNTWWFFAVGFSFFVWWVLMVQGPQVAKAHQIQDMVSHKTSSDSRGSTQTTEEPTVPVWEGQLVKDCVYNTFVKEHCSQSSGCWPERLKDEDHGCYCRNQYSYVALCMAEAGSSPRPGMCNP